ncbi:hypothetical protein NW852_12925, partial [Synechococcus sp. H60.1]|uniref:hypothetical protein n=1 Tax=Synechococcus sp. H60.1 TaxID=2964517 RepID=UPI0039C3EE1E
PRAGAGGRPGGGRAAGAPRRRGPPAPRGGLRAKWTGVLFLLPPLLAVPLGVKLPWPVRLAHLALGMGVTLLLCWPWYGANWLFVFSNGWAYAETAHYYVTCPAGSLCWWTAYLRVLPLQMSPFLCPLPLLSLWGSPSRRETLLWGLYGSGYLLYTLVAIKDVRFTLPLLPLLAILSAGGLDKVWRWLGARWGQRALRQGVGLSLALGSLALLNLGQPLTPGVAPLWKGIQMRWQGQHPQQELTRWIGSLVQPGLATTLGVLPNTELISSETLSYLAALQRWPITFRGAGQTPWPELELALLDGFVDAPGEQGIVGPYGPAKEQIRQLLDKSPDWQQEHFELQAVGRLYTYFPTPPRVVLQEVPAPVEEVELLQLKVFPEEGIPAWRLRWQGPAQDLAQTLVWARLENPQEQILAEQAWVVGQNRLQPRTRSNWQVEEILTLPLWPESAGEEGILHLEWQPPKGMRRSLRQHWRGSPGREKGSLIPPGDLLFPLRQAARAAAAGDLEALSLYLNAWTTLQYATFATDPDRILTRQLLEGEQQQAADQGQIERQIQSHYELGLMEVALLQPEAAQQHFQRIVELDPEDDWARAYLAFLQVFFTHDIRSLQGLKQELAAAVYPLCQKANLDWDLSWLCAAL